MLSLLISLISLKHVDFFLRKMFAYRSSVATGTLNHIIAVENAPL